MIKFIQKQIRKFNYYNKFINLPLIKGLNPDKHDQVFNSFFNAEEKSRGF